MQGRFDQEKYFQPYKSILQKNLSIRSKNQPYSHNLNSKFNQQKNSQLKRLSPVIRLDRSNQRSLSPNNIRLSPKNKGTNNQRKKSIWNDLYEKGLQQRKKILKMHKQKDQKLDQQCTFKPILRGKSERYIVPNQFNFMERNNVWIQNKIVKIVKQKEELTNLGLKECTFSPQINKKSRFLKQQIKKQQNKYLNKSILISRKNQVYKKNSLQDAANNFKIPYNLAKNKIRIELQNIIL